jgi:hypothetical protein
LAPKFGSFEDVAIVFHVLGFYLEQFVWLLFGVVVSVDVTHDSSPVYVLSVVPTVSPKQSSDTAFSSQFVALVMFVFTFLGCDL